ncbi:MAG: lytic murein transglycosylase, partial [Pseudomonadota bacterium]|nr:lytic murein transglycosylase [Pseudomonadota bacterium]
MRPIAASLLALTTALALGTSATAQSCGGSFGNFVGQLKAQAQAQGYPATLVDNFFAGTSQSAAVLKADRAQGVFQKDFIEFSRMLISQNRMDAGAANWRKYRSTF